MIWALDDAGRGARVGGRQARRYRAGAGRVAAVQRRPDTGHRRCGAQWRLRRERPRLRWRAARPHGARRDRLVDPASMLVDVLRRHLRRRVRRRAPRTTRRHLRSLAAIDGAVDGRRLARVPWRRTALDALRKDRGHRRRTRRRARRRNARSNRRRAARRGRPGPLASVPRIGRHARHHRRGTVALPIALRHRRYGPRTPSPRSVDGLDAMRRIVQRGRDARRPTALRRHRIRPDLSHRRPASPVAARRRRRARHRGDPAHRRRGVHRGRRRAVRCRPSSNGGSAPQRRLGARSPDLPRAGRRHDGGLGVVARAPEVYDAHHSRRSGRSSTRWPCPHTRATRIPTAAACTSRSPGGLPPTTASATTARSGTPVSGRCSPPAARCRITTASG